MEPVQSYVEANSHVLKELRTLTPQKRQYILSKSGPDLIFAFAEIFLNLIHNSNKNNLKDTKTVNLIKKNFNDIGTLIHPLSSIRKKRAILINNLALQKLALSVGFSGYEFYKENISQNFK